jgi:hypothetical protein
LGAKKTAKDSSAAAVPFQRSEVEFIKSLKNESNGLSTWYFLTPYLDEPLQSHQ